MTIYRVSELTGRTRKRQLPITEQQYYDFMCNHTDQLPQLNEDQMRFLMTGVVAEELKQHSNDHVIKVAPSLKRADNI
jgi:hypothetical protein